MHDQGAAEGRRLAHQTHDGVNCIGVARAARGQRGQAGFMASRASVQGADGSAFFEQAPGLQCSAGLNGHFLHLSPLWSTALGWTRAQLTARPCIEFVHPEDRAAVLAHMQSLLREGGTLDFECRLLAPDGSSRWLRWQATGLPARGCLQAVVHDVTETHGLRQALLAAADHERERLGRELHDGLCQHLAGIAAMSAALSRRLPLSGATACAADVAEIGVLLKQAVVCARDLAHGLCPAELRADDLNQAIEVLAANVGALFGVVCTFESRQPCPDLGVDGQMHLFRIVQEAVHNAVIHGRSRRVDIVLSAEPGEGLVCISDDGAGLPDHDLVKRGMGLRSMAYRARMLGGTLVVRRQLPVGTVLSCTFRVPGADACSEGVG